MMGLLIALVLLLMIPMIIVWMKVYQNSEKIDKLSREVRSLKKHINSLDDSKTTAKHITQVKQEKIIVQSQTQFNGETPKPSLGEQIFSDTPTETKVDNSKTEKSALTKNEWELFIGGKVLNRLGAIALVIGFGFFLKYAFDNQLISENSKLPMEN